MPKFLNLISKNSEDQKFANFEKYARFYRVQAGF